MASRSKWDSELFSCKYPGLFIVVLRIAKIRSENHSLKITNDVHDHIRFFFHLIQYFTLANRYKTICVRSAIISWSFISWLMEYQSHLDTMGPVASFSSWRIREMDKKNSNFSFQKNRVPNNISGYGTANSDETWKRTTTNFYLYNNISKLASILFLGCEIRNLRKIKNRIKKILKIFRRKNENWNSHEMGLIYGDNASKKYKTTE